MDDGDAISRPQMRRLPVYLILWCSSRMAGQPLANELRAVNQLLDALRGDRHAVEAAYVSVITVGSPQVTIPLTSLHQFVLPRLEASGPGYFSEALKVLEASLENDIVPNSTEGRGDYNPLVYVFMSGKPTDHWQHVASRIIQRRGSKGTFITGLALDTEAQDTLANLTSVVISVDSDGLQSVTPLMSTVLSTLRVHSGAVASNDNDTSKVALPAPPPGIVEYDSEPEYYQERRMSREETERDKVRRLLESERIRLEYDEYERLKAEASLSISDVALSPDGILFSSDGQAVIELPAQSSESRIWEQPSDAPTPQADSTESGSGASSEDPSDVTSQSEQVTFTAYHPKEFPLHTWAALVTYISLDTPEQQRQVERQATERLASQRGLYRPASSVAPTQLRRGSMLTFVPRLPGLRVNPPTLTVAWEEDVQQVEFRIRADHVSPGQAVNGVIQVFAGPLLRADIPISIFIRSQEAENAHDVNVTRVLANAYRRVFASYSHRDTPIVRACETAVETIGDRYLRDVRLLRSGEQWDERLLQAIGEADVFQLFWSKRAAISPAVEREWRHALSLAAERSAFIRPVYWSRQPYHVPMELNSIHFERLDLTTLGMGAVRRIIYTMTS